MPAPNRGDDFIGIGGPDEGFWLAVVLCDEAVDRGLQINGRAEHAAFCFIHYQGPSVQIN